MLFTTIAFMEYKKHKDTEMNLKKFLIEHKNKVNFYTFWSYGWIGQYERLHKIGLITSYDISEIFKLNQLKLPFFRKIEHV